MGYTPDLSACQVLTGGFPMAQVKGEQRGRIVRAEELPAGLWRGSFAPRHRNRARHRSATMLWTIESSVVGYEGRGAAPL